MLVCLNGHVLTDRLQTFPEQDVSHCDRCGAVTLSHCRTCGQELPGAASLPGPTPIGRPRPPLYCAQCGAAFPWAPRPQPSPAVTPLAALETLLRRVPLVARGLRDRRGDRPPFRVEDQRDLEDLLRALLPLQFDGIRSESRAPLYAPGRRTDYFLPGGLVLTAKLAGLDFTEVRLAAELREEAAHYRGWPGCAALACFVYDPEKVLPDRERVEAACSRPEDDLDVRCVIA
jgi:hypothetical protein